MSKSKHGTRERRILYKNPESINNDVEHQQENILSGTSESLNVLKQNIETKSIHFVENSEGTVVDVYDGDALFFRVYEPRGDNVQYGLIFPDGSVQRSFAEEKKMKPELTEEVYIDKQSSVLTTPERIHFYLKKFVKNTSDHRGNDHHQSAEETVKRGAGDCEDFAEYAKELLAKNGKRAWISSIMTDVEAAEDHAQCIFTESNADGTYTVTSIDDFWGVRKVIGPSVKHAFFKLMDSMAIKTGYLNGGLVCPKMRLLDGNTFVPVERLHDTQYMETYIRSKNSLEEINKVLKKYPDDVYLLYEKITHDLRNKYSRDSMDAAKKILTSGYAEMPFVIDVITNTKLMSESEKKEFFLAVAPNIIDKYINALKEVGMEIAPREKEMSEHSVKEILLKAGYPAEEIEKMVNRAQ